MNCIKNYFLSFCVLAFCSCSSSSSNRLIASDNLNEQNENWSFVSSDKFSFIDSLTRGQGLTSDDMGNIYFSSNHSLIKTKAQSLDKSEIVNLVPFGGPISNREANELTQLGIDHIGDIDFVAKKIVTSMEDGRSFKNPVVAFFDSDKLKLQGFVKLPNNLQPDGVPWVCVNPSINSLITSKYNNVTSFNVFDLNSIDFIAHTIKPLESINLPKRIDGIQGVKYFNDSFYITSNNKGDKIGFPIYKFNPQSNTMSTIALMPQEVTEIEGLTFIKNKDQNQIEMYVIGIIGAKLNRRVKVYKFKLN